VVYSALLLKNAGLQKRINFWANQTIPKIQQKRTDIYSWANARVLLKYKKSCPGYFSKRIFQIILFYVQLKMCIFVDKLLIMKDFVFYIKLEHYLAQWLTHSLGNPVRFPAQSNENSVIRRFLQKLPPDKLPEMPSDDTVAIVIPDSKAKDPAVYNYLGPLAKEAVVESIEDLFRRNLWAELGDMTSSSVGLNKTIAAWCEMHGIDIDYIETVRQKYYRMRNAYNRKGMFLGSLTRKREDKTPVFVQHRTTANNTEQL
jgi:hypothetical protein